MGDDRVLDRYERCWNNGDIDGIMSCFAHDATCEDVARGEKLEGHDAIRAWLSPAFTTFTGFGIDWTSRVVSPEGGYALEWTMRGTHTGDLRGLPPTGRSMAVRGASIGRLEGDRIVQNTDYWSPADLMTQLGMAPPPN